MPKQRVPATGQARARDLGVTLGILPTGPLNAITDVAGVCVGHTTLIRGDNIRTGVTAILPHSGNLFREKVPAAVFVANGFGKLAGVTQVNELGEIETPILLGSTLSVPRIADAVIDYMLALPGNENIQSINPLVGETNDGKLNDIRCRSIRSDDVFGAIARAKGGPVNEGSVGAGTGTMAFGFKGGIGSSSRRLPSSLGGYTVGVLVQTNFGGILTVSGVAVGQELGRYYLKEQLVHPAGKAASWVPKATSRAHFARKKALQEDPAGGSVMIVIATDAAVDHRNLHRMAARAMMGLARTGSSGSHDSGDYAIAFSTAPALRIQAARSTSSQHSRKQYSPQQTELLANEAMSPLFLSVIEATEEAVHNSLFCATTITGLGRTVEALPIERTLQILAKYGKLGQTK
jgi:D-aminopeptidase